MADLSLSPDGKTLAATHLNQNFNGGLEIRSVPRLELIRTVAVPIGTVGRFTHDGRSLIYGDRDGRVYTLDTRTWKPRGRPIAAHGSILTADLSPDGRLLATTSTDGTGRLWDLASGRPIGATLSGSSGDPIGAAFIRRGTHLAVVHDHGGVVGTSARSHGLATRARSPDARSRRSEWATALPQHRLRARVRTALEGSSD